MLRLTLLAGTAAALIPQIALAQANKSNEAPPAKAQVGPSSAAGSSRDSIAGVAQHEESEEIIVTANYIRDLDILAGTSVLTGTDLVRDLRPQIGDTLARLPRGLGNFVHTWRLAPCSPRLPG